MVSGLVMSQTHRRLQLHGPGLPDLVLAGVQVQPLVLKDLPLLQILFLFKVSYNVTHQLGCRSRLTHGDILVC